MAVVFLHLPPPSHMYISFITFRSIRLYLPNQVYIFDLEVGECAVRRKLLLYSRFQSQRPPNMKTAVTRAVLYYNKKAHCVP